MNVEEEINEISTDEAALSALSPKRLGELELQPFSLLRQAIAVDLCGAGRGMNFFNAVMTVWVCTLSPTEALRAHENLDQARLDAFGWAEKQGYSLANFEPLINAYMRINQELEASVQVQVRLPLGVNGGESKNAGGQPASLS
jgi:hypothetical protein